MIFIHKLSTCRFTGQSKVIIQESFHVKGINKLIRVKFLDTTGFIKVDTTKRVFK